MFDLQAVGELISDQDLSSYITAYLLISVWLSADMRSCP
ncbi:hypothetical protein SAMN05216368_12418 [Cryobacterium flavum]|uniref:Uncharacterized protein n=1 Tax=Cryobacterium flavum TaxID=1424659 RepID=A0A5E9G3N3_9MICO|nr:hypothetical protein SAMN05216368_12418 [Cryobacterium flavum]